MLDCQKELFDLEAGQTYLNCAYMSPQLKSVTQIGQEMVARKGRPYRIKKEDFFTPLSELKQLAAQIIHTNTPERIALCPSVSYAMANVAKNIKWKNGAEVLMVEEQFPSNYYIWEREARLNGAQLRSIPLQNQAESPAKALNKAILEAINEHTVVVTIGNIHWADGTLIDLMAIREKSLEVGAKLVIDGTQSVGALPINVEQLQPDALINACYKWLFGPYQSGIAYFGPAFDDGNPIEENWINRLNSHDFKNLVNYQPAYKPYANRYCVGEHSNFIFVPMMIRAFQQILAWTVPAIQAYCDHIAKNTLEELQEMGCLIEARANRCTHMLGVRFTEKIDQEALGNALKENQVSVSFRGDAMRISPNVYNDEQDFEVLLNCFKTAYRPATTISLG